MRRLCVVIVNYRKPGLTVDCLRSIEPELADVPDMRVVVVDNASGDDSLEMLRSACAERDWHDWLTIVESPANLGFAGGNNIGIRAEPANAYLLLNNDTIVKRGAFALLLETMDANEMAGLVGPRILDPDGTAHVSCFRNRSPISEMLGAAKTSPLTKLLRRFDVPLSITAPGEPCDPEWIGFACVLVRGEVFRDVGLLDERYFMYFEDIDFCIRAREASWQIVHDARAEVVHLEGGSSDVIASFRGRKRVAKFYYESRARYFATHYGGRLGLWGANVLWMLGRCISLLREVAGAKKPHTAADEGRDNWTNWWQPLRSREGTEKRDEVHRTPTLEPSGSDAHAGRLGDRLAPHDSVGAVAIGRNEGERLRRCLESAVRDAACAVYVDSGSTDSSIELANSLGVDVVELDMSQPFTAARARNAGIERLRTSRPALEFVHVVDGDCEIVDGWMDAAMEFITSHERVAVVCGRRRERHPEASPYNRLCNLEWDTPIGEARACGGDALIRLEALQAVGGFNPNVIAGEEPELCVRLRQAGWTIHRIDHEMTVHDAQMTRFGQWWKRAKRAGHAYAEGAAMHGTRAGRHWVKESRSAWFWGLVVWLVAIAAAPLTYGLSLLLLLGYVVLYVRVARWCRSRGWSRRDARLYARFTVLGKLPECIGMMTYWLNRLRGRRTKLMEYKTDTSTRQHVNKSTGGNATEVPPV